MATVETQSIPLDLRSVSFFNNKSQILNAQRTSKLMAQQTKMQAEADRQRREQAAKNGDERIIGAHFQEWRIGKVLGTGAFASVSEAACTLPSCGREVKAVLKSSKIMGIPTQEPSKDSNEGEEENQHQFLYVIRELTTLVHLSRAHPSFPGTDTVCYQKYGHPTIVKIFDGIFDEPNREFHTFMQRAQGIELFDYLRSKGGKLDEYEIKIIMKQLLDALDYMHANLVLHRDIKLDNIIIDPKTLKIILIDFNLSTFYYPNIPLHEPVGCINYSSPQILETAIHPERGGYFAERGWSDLWASGIVAYGMLVGFFPFRSQTPRKLFSEIMRLSKKPLEWVDANHVSPQARRFVEKMLNPALCGTLTAGELLEDEFLKGVDVPVTEALTRPAPISMAKRVSSLESDDTEPAWLPPAHLPENLRKFWSYYPQGVAPEMVTEDLDTQFFAVRRAMFDMLGVEPPKCVVDQEARIAKEVDQGVAMDLDDHKASRDMDWQPTDDEKLGPGMPPREGSSAHTIMVAASGAKPNSNFSDKSDNTAVGSRPSQDMDQSSGGSAGTLGKTEQEMTAAEVTRERTRRHELKLSAKSKMSIAKLVKTGWARVKDSVHDWKACGGKGMTGVTPSEADLPSQ